MVFAPDREGLACAAWFFNGEGHVGSSVGVKANRPRHDIYLSISQTDRWVLDKFREFVGGLGSVSGPFVRRYRNPNENDVYYYQVASYEYVQAIIAMLWPWFSPVKRAQARLAIEAMRGHGNGQRRAKYWLACKRGHPRTPENTKRYSFHGYDCRRCLVCQREQHQRLYLKHKTAAALLVAV